MSKHYLEPANDHVMTVDNVVDTVIGDIIMPDNHRQKELECGTVVAVGPDCVNTHQQETVAYGPYAGKHVVIEGVQFRILKEGQIEGYLRKTQ